MSLEPVVTNTQFTAAEAAILAQIADLGDPGANVLLGYDNTDDAYRHFTIGTGLSYDHSTHTLSSTGSITGSGTANEITYWVSSSVLGSLAVATYPSLTELSYVKGATSSLQTQITARALAATTITIAGTASQITSSAGAQDLSTNRTWTLSFPADVLIPTVLTVPNTGLHLLDTNASHDLIIKPGSDLTADHTLTFTTGDADRTLTIGADSSISGTAYVVGGTDVAVTDGGTGVSAISALSVWVANSANTITEVTPGAGKSIRINAGGTAWEAFTPSATVPTTITVADEATDTSCFIAFFTAATGDLGPKTNVNMTFNSNTGVATFASTVLTTSDINGGTLDNVVIGASTAAAATITTLIITSFGGNWTNAGRTVADMGILTTVDINGGTVDGTVIGASLAAAATFTTIAGTVATLSTTAQVILATNTNDNASVQLATFQGDRATMAANDEGYISLKLSDSAGNQDEMARITWKATTVTSTSEVSRLQFGVVTGGTLADELYLTSTALSPAADGGNSLGTTALGWQNLFGNTGFVFNIENGDWVATHTTGILTVGTGDLRVTNNFTNATSVVTLGGAQTLSNKVLTAATITTSLVPTSDDGAALGDATHNFSDLFLASGALIKFASTNVVLTHTSGILTMTTGDLRVTSANVGTNGDSVPTLSSTSTLTNKTLTSPTLTTPSAFTTGGTITLAENTSIALDPAGSADGKYTGITITGVAGYAAASGAFGDLVYLAVADSRWEKCDADALATAGNVLIGMMLTDTTSDGGACNILLQGQIRADAKFPALTVGAGAYVGETAGAIQVAIPTGADNIIRVVGFALTADEIYFNPSQDWQVTVA